MRTKPGSEQVCFYKMLKKFVRHLHNVAMRCDFDADGFWLYSEAHKALQCMKMFLRFVNILDQLFVGT